MSIPEKREVIKEMIEEEKEAAIEAWLIADKKFTTALENSRKNPDSLVRRDRSSFLRE